jgi:hypothetical protein
MRIPKFKLTLEPQEAASKGLPRFEYAADDVGKRHQLGGEPLLLQELDWPMCPDCGKEMTFYAQLDSISDDVIIADCGMVYVFVCFDCNETKSIIQSG